MNPPAVDLRRQPATETADPLALPMDEAVRLEPFRLMDDSAAAHWSTAVRVAFTAGHLHVVYDCGDDDAWGTFARRDDPLWQEEVVELFLFPGEATPACYYEIEVSPLGALFDARVENPRGDRIGMIVDTGWNCDGIRWRVERLPERQDWRARLAIPWRGIGLEHAPRFLRANFFRVERPRDGAEEFSGWSPTLTTPPDFHRPKSFGLLRFFD